MSGERKRTASSVEAVAGRGDGSEGTEEGAMSVYRFYDLWARTVQTLREMGRRGSREDRR